MAGKVEKLNLALPEAAGEVLWFLDDDVAPRQGAARTLAAYLQEPRAGSAFGNTIDTIGKTIDVQEAQ